MNMKMFFFYCSGSYKSNGWIIICPEIQFEVLHMVGTPMKKKEKKTLNSDNVLKTNCKSLLKMSINY